MKRTRLTDLLLVGTAAGLIAGCAPKRIDLYEAEMFQGTPAEFTEQYGKREGVLDAAETAREADALKDMMGVQYQSKDAYLSDLQERVGKKRALDIAIYGTTSVIVDGLKLYMFSGGGDGKGVVNRGSDGGSKSMSASGSQETIIYDSFNSGM